MMPERSDRITIGVCRILLLFCYLAGASPVAAYGQGTIDVEPAHAARLEAAPGKVVTAVFRVHSRAPAARSLTPSIDLPEGWRLVVPLQPLSMPARSEATYLVSLLVPPQTAAGGYPVRLTLQTEADPADAASGVVMVDVLPHHRLVLSVDRAPRFARAGSAYEARFVLINEGNAAATAALRLRSTEGFEVLADSAVFTLPPQAVRQFAVTVRTPPDLREKRRHTVRVQAFVVEAPGVSASASTSIDIIPDAAQVRAASSTFPLQVSVGLVGDEQRGGVLLGVDGTGTLFGGRFAAQVRLPDQQRTSVYGQRSRYTFSYTGTHTAFQLGDHVYALSPLTEAGQYGLGAGGTVQLGRFSLGGFLQQSRYLFPRETQRGTSATYRIAEGAEVQASFLSRDGLLEGEMLTLRSRLAAGTRTMVDLECGLGGRGSLGQGACSFALSGNRPRLTYNAQYVQAAPAFPGYHQNLNLKSAAFAVRPQPWLRLEAAGRDHRQGFGAGGPQAATRTDRFYRLGGGVTGRPLGDAAFLFAHFQNRRLRHAADGFVFDQREASVRLRLGYQLRRAGFGGSLALGRTSSAGAGFAGRFQQVKLQARLAPRRGQIFGAAVEHLAGVSLYQLLPQRRWMVNLSADLELAARTRFFLNFYGSLTQRQDRFRYLFAQARLEHTFRAGHRLGLRGQYGSIGALQEGAGDYSLTYTVPVGLPVPGSRPAQPLTGRIYDAETGAPVEGALLQLGDELALTDASGKFAFPAQAPGTYLLQLDRLSIGLERVSVHAMPMEVQVDEAGLPAFDLAVVRSARLTGRLARLGASGAAGEGHDEEQGPVRILLELASGSERYRALADVHGRFSFDHLRPGGWRLCVIHAELPPYHDLEKEEYDLHLAPGEMETVQIYMLQKKRRMQILEGGTLRLED